MERDEPLPPLSTFTQAPSSVPAKISNPPASGSNVTSQASIATSSAPKRKAEQDLNHAATKSARSSDLANSTGEHRQRDLPSASTTPSAPYRGTMRPTQPLASAQNSSTTSSASSATSAAVPRKGSYAEVLARAKAVEQNKGAIGVIKHKAVDKTSHRRKLARDLKAKNAGKESLQKGIGSGEKGQPKGADAGKSGLGEAPKEKKKPIDLGYTGTMRAPATVPAYKGTMGKPISKPEKSPQTLRVANSRVPNSRVATSRTLNANSGGPKSKVRIAGYASYSENDSVDNDSDASSDMEAGNFDLEEEEEASLRAAKKEDEAALAEENEHKRRKSERKAMMQKMAATAKKNNKSF
jgi:protein SPT2